MVSIDDYEIGEFFLVEIELRFKVVIRYWSCKKKELGQQLGVERGRE